MSGNRIAQDDQEDHLGTFNSGGAEEEEDRLGTFDSGGEDDDDDESDCPSRRKRIRPALGLALTVAFLVCTTLATGCLVPPQTATQTMKLLKGGEREDQAFVLLATQSFSASSSNPALPTWIGRLSKSKSVSKGKKRKLRVERRWLAGPGSHPPSCKSKCGRCVPCNPVRVPIHPGRKRPLEYYPEAWRCKCGNKLYMP